MAVPDEVHAHHLLGDVRLLDSLPVAQRRGQVLEERDELLLVQRFPVRPLRVH